MGKVVAVKCLVSSIYVCVAPQMTSETGPSVRIASWYFIGILLLLKALHRLVTFSYTTGICGSPVSEQFPTIPNKIPTICNGS